MSRRHTDIWSHPSHYLVDPYTWPWSPNGQDHIWPSKFKYWFKVMAKVKPIGHIWGLEFKSICLLFVSWLSGQLWLRYIKIHISPWKFKVKVTAKVKSDGHIWGQRVQSMCLLFVLWQSDHFWQRYSQVHIWPWKFKVKVMSKVKPDGHIWGLEINGYVCFLFRGNRTIFDWDIAKSIFNLENSRSRSWPRSKPMVTFEA